MARPRTVTITLTPRQRTQIKRLTGEDHKELKVARSALGVKSAPRKFALDPKRPMPIDGY